MGEGGECGVMDWKGVQKVTASGEVVREGRLLHLMIGKKGKWVMT